MIVLHIGHYSAHEYEKFKVAAKDPEIWSDQYSEWLENYREKTMNLQGEGYHVLSVEMNLSEFELWCIAKGTQNDGEGRCQYITDKGRSTSDSNPN